MELRQWQKDGMDFILENKKCMMWMRPGSGKTLMVLSAIKKIMSSRLDFRFLIVAPLRVSMMVWQDEASKWDETKDIEFVNLADHRRTSLRFQNKLFNALNGHRASIVNYEYFSKLMDICRKKECFPWNMVVFDEISRLKSHKTMVSKSANKMRKEYDPEYIIGLTGTPISNSYLDLFSEYEAVNGAKYLAETFYKYQHRFFYVTNPYAKVYKFNWVPRRGSEESIRKKIAHCTYCPKAIKFGDEPIYQTHYYKMKDDAMLAYNIMKKKRVIEKNSVKAIAANSEVAMSKLLQIASGFCYGENSDGKKETIKIHNGKIDILESIIEDMRDSGERLIVFYNFIEEGNIIREAINLAYGTNEEDNPCDLTIAMRGKAMNDLISASPDKSPVICANPKSCGHGLDGLQHTCSRVVFYGLPWSREIYDQAIGRIARMGQERQVYVDHIVSKGTLDEVVIDVLNKRGNVAEALLAALEV